MARTKGRFSTTSKPAAREASSSTASDSTTTGGSSRGFLKYVVFAFVGLFVSMLASLALVTWLGTVAASITSTTPNTSLLTMLDAWFFPMLTLSIIVAGVTLAMLRRLWHALERRFG